MRVALAVEYDGSQYHGWQNQPNLHTVQGCVEKALSRVADHEVQVHCAGRTDTGVHASGQVIHFDSKVERSMSAWVYGSNSHLPKDICIRWAKLVDEQFHARFSATARRYRYVIYNNPIRPAIFRSGVTWHYRQLDHCLMHDAAQCLLGENDFSSFRAVECQSKTAMRNIHKITVNRDRDTLIIDITANAFLHHMVRNIVGVLMAVGSGRKPKHWVKEVLDAKDRRLGGETAPAYGLYLVQVQYPKHFALPRLPIGPTLLTAEVSS